jgi:serine/threonine protein phosphatase PrpC
VSDAGRGVREPSRFVSAATTHVGLVRQVNEDRCLARPDIGLWAVADGMGGHYAGAHASQAIVDALDAVPPPSSARDFMARVCQSLTTVNGALRSRAASFDDGRTIASTVVCLLAFERHFACVWAGDSRLYLLRSGRLAQITKDHSVVQQLVEGGALTSEEARHHPQANIVTRAVGGADAIELDATQGSIEPNDLFLLCTDGITKMVPDIEIQRTLASQAVKEIVRSLTQSALENGGIDNLAAIAVLCICGDGRLQQDGSKHG